MYCKDSIAVEEEQLKRAICRGLSKAIADKQEVYDLILSNLAYAFTGEEDTLDICAIEQQIKKYDEEIDDTVKLSKRSEGDPKKFRETIQRLCEQIIILRQQLEIAKAKIASNERLSWEIERLKAMLAEQEIGFHQFDDVTVRLLVEYIRVMSDGKIIIVLKGGIQVEEEIGENSGS